MLIEFKVSNYRSFDEEVVFSMAAAPRLKKKENTFLPKLKGDALPPLLKTAAIYGPNASGKSNLINALGVLNMVFRSSDAERKVFDVQPFKLNEPKDTVSKFCIAFIHADMRYEFGLWLTKERVIKEWLRQYPLGEEVLLFERNYNADKLVDDYIFGECFEGDDALHQLWIKLVSSKALFIKQAAANSGEAFKQLKLPVEWFQDVLFVTGVDKISFLTVVATNFLAQSQSAKTAAVNLISSVDIPISDISIKQGSDGAGNEVFETKMTHNLGGQLVEFDFQDESDGTKNLFALAPLWGSSKTHFKVLVFDEFDSSLHPEIVAKLVEQQSKNTDNAQFILTTHDTHLMNAKILRRDQFWFMERSRQGSSHMRCLYEYKGREGEDIEKRYYEGRYRALPIMS
jgi:AAA15 family ATPase/GTPase